MKPGNRIVVLGGSYLQSYFIRNAVSVCEKVFVLDGNSHCYAAQNNLGEFHPVNFSDVELTKAFCKEQNVQAILAPVNEFGNIISADISAELGYTYNRPEVVRITSDKALFSSLLQKSGFRTTRSFSALKSEEIEYPVIVKPTQSTSSKGVSLVSKPQQLEAAMAYAVLNSKTKEIRIEEYIEGQQFSVETISCQGKHQIVGVVEEHLSEAPYFFERSDIIDHYRQSEYREMLNPFIQRLLDLLEVEVGPCHIEVRVRNNEVYLIDLASRSGGWRDILLFHSGINYNQLILDSYLGKLSFDEFKKPTHTVGAGIMLYHEDMLRMKKAAESGRMLEAFLNGSLPHIMPKTLADAYGYYFLKGNKRDEIGALLPKII